MEEDDLEDRDFEVRPSLIEVALRDDDEDGIYLTQTLNSEFIDLISKITNLTYFIVNERTFRKQDLA